MLSAIGIAGIDRLVQKNVLAMSGRSVEAAGLASTVAKLDARFVIKDSDDSLKGAA